MNTKEVPQVRNKGFLIHGTKICCWSISKMFPSLWNQPMFKACQASSAHAVVAQIFDEPDLTSPSLRQHYVWGPASHLRKTNKWVPEMTTWLTLAISNLKSTSLNLEHVRNIVSGYILVVLNSDPHHASFLTVSCFHFAFLKRYTSQQIWLAQSSL